MKTLCYPMSLILAACAFSSACSPDHDLKSTNYYLDSKNGSDSNSGLSPSQAWKSLDRLAGVTLAPGDSILLRRGSSFIGRFDISAQGTSDARIVIDAYGEGDRPCISAPDSSLYAVAIRNSDYVTLQNIEVVNTGSVRMAKRTGVAVECENYGVSHNIILNALYIHDVNGSPVKEEGGGSAILISNRWDKDNIVSIYDSLRIENCIIRRCERNAMIWNAPWSRTDWHPSTNTVVARNLIEEVPGDGIVPIGCDGAIVEYNLMRDCPMTLPDTEAAAGMWPWSCDNTIIRFNEASGHKAPWDAQGYDSDYNCRNTTIEYNFSHDNDGGFLLVCNSGESPEPDNIGNSGTVVKYNISIGDAVRSRLTRAGVFSPTIHFAGPTDSTLIEKNIFLVTEKPSEKTDRHILTSDSWGGYSSNATFRDNVFCVAQPSAFNLTESTGNLFSGNFYIGDFASKPDDNNSKDSLRITEEKVRELLREVKIANGEATLTTVDKEKIESFFKGLIKP